MKETYNELSSEYMRDLKKLLDKKKISKYDIAHASFRKNNAHWIIKKNGIDKINLSITYLNGDTRIFPTYNELIKRVTMANEDYKPARRKHIKKYYRIIHALTKHRARFNNNNNSIANRLNPKQIRLLASQI